VNEPRASGDGAPAPPALRATIDLRAPAPPAGFVVVHNDGPAAVRVWRTGNEWGDDALFFEVSHGGRTARVLSRGQNYTRNVPSAVGVSPGSGHEWPFDLGDGTWDTEPPAVDAPPDAAELVAVYAPRESPEAVAAGVWVGEVRSAPVTLETWEPPRMER
jgi:hypothetical protein